MATGQLDVVSRDTWFADPPRARYAVDLPIKYVFCAMSTRCEPCKDTDHCQALIREMQFEHAQMEKLPDIRYNFLIGGDAKIYEGRGWDLAPSLPPKYEEFNARSLYIGFIGNLYGKLPAREVLDARDDIIKSAMLKRYLDLRFTEFLLLKDFEED